ncbi:MAG: CPBP family intramembrane metalloprotease [Ruminococcaceae bacterium]|nr:CPBP family intramembrane metalloprotease [Oscillospiraceae bacterium]
MSEELIMTEGISDNKEKMQDFKHVCLCIGMMMIIVFVSRIAASIISTLLIPYFAEMEMLTAYILESVLSFVFLYVVPIAGALIIFRPKGLCRDIYKKPVYASAAMGMFPAFYGLAIFTNLITIFIGSFFKETDLNESFNTVNELQPENLSCALVLFVQLVVIAPLFEEFWYRGIVMKALQPYGNGFAIFASALLFGLTHANLQQFFYATALGICLGYIAVTTKSIVVTTIMHAMFNSISGIMLLFMSLTPVQDYMLGNGDTSDPLVGAFLVYMFIIIMLLIVGILMAIWKLRKIRRYRVEKVWDVPASRRWGIFFTRVTVIIMLVLAADTLTFRLIPTGIYKLIAGVLG